MPAKDDLLRSRRLRQEIYGGLALDRNRHRPVVPIAEIGNLLASVSDSPLWERPRLLRGLEDSASVRLSLDHCSSEFLRHLGAGGGKRREQETECEQCRR